MKLQTSLARQSAPAPPVMDELEPGVLPVFRVVAAIQFGLALLFTLTGTVDSDSISAIHFPFALIWTGLLLLYLWQAPRLLPRLGRFYLPLAVIFATLCTQVEHAWQLWALTHDVALERSADLAAAGGWRLLIGLLMPLLVIATQYNLRILGVYVFLMGLIEGMIFEYVFETDRILPLGVIAAPPAIFGLIGFIVNRMITAQREQRKALAEANTQLAQYAATLEQLTVSRERNRLARELHDTLAHTLSAVSVQLEAVDSAWDVQPEKARELLGKSLAQTRSGLTETRRALQALRASPVDDLGLALAVRNLAESMAKRGGLTLNLSVAEVDVLAPEVEQQIYRIAQEALMNVYKHSNARNVEVTLAHSPAGLVLTVADDGQGFDVAQIAANDQYGLRGMQERAELIGAQLTVARGTRQGTTVRLDIPNHD